MVNLSIVITGPTSGIGLACLERLSKFRNHYLVLVGRGLTRIISIVNQKLPDTCCVEYDFSSFPNTNALNNLKQVTTTLTTKNKSNHIVFINNAGTIAPIISTLDLPLDDLDHAMKVNFLSPVAIAQTLAKIAKFLNKKLIIINITTGAAVKPIKNWLSYCTSKCACKMALNIIAKENSFVELVNLDPGVVDTKMQSYIRNINKGIISEAKTFESFKQQGMLKPPNKVSQEILEIIFDHTK